MVCSIRPRGTPLAAARHRLLRVRVRAQEPDSTTRWPSVEW